MKSAVKTSSKSSKKKSSLPTKTNDKQKKAKKRNDKESVQLVAQEIKFARSLCGNEKKNRDRVLKTLRKWLAIRCEQNYEFKRDDFMRIWKGLFYAMWMSDKPLIQEELSESISALLDIFPASNTAAACLFFDCGVRSLATEWYGLDQHRTDKFMMFVRRMLRAAFRSLRRASWSSDACTHFAQSLGGVDAILNPCTPTYARNALSLQLHIVEIFVEELAKISEGDLPEQSLSDLLSPLVRCMALSREPRLSGAVKKYVFVQLLRQSESGLEYEAKKKAWAQMGYPEGGVDCVVKVSDDEEEAEDSDEELSRPTALDPRAGRVDVILPSLPVPATALCSLLRPLLLDTGTSTPNRKRMRKLLQHLEEMSAGRYPLRAPEESLSSAAAARGAPRPAPAARRLHEFEKKMIAEADELALRGLSRKHRKRILAKVRDRLSNEDTKQTKQATQEKSRKRRHSAAARSSGEWKVEETVPEQKKQKLENKSENKKQVAKKEDGSKPNKIKKIPTALADEVPLKKLKKILTEKEKKNVIDKKKSDISNKADKLKLLKSVEKSKSLVKVDARSNDDTVKVKKEDPKPKMNGTSKITNYDKQKLRGKKEKVADAKEKLKDSRTKKVTIVLKNNTAQRTIDYYKSVKQSPSIPFDGTKKPAKTNLKPNSAPSPINPFFKKKLKLNF